MSKGVTELWLRVPSSNGMIVYRPLPSQYEFHADPSKFRWYVGGMGAGKSLAGCVEALATAMAYPGSVGLVARWTHRELMNTTWRTLKSIIPRNLLARPIVESPQKCQIEIRAPDGRVSTIIGAGLSNMDAVFSMELAWAYLDEGSQVPAKHGNTLWKLIESRLRGPVGPYRAWVTGNPNGRDWLWRKFVGQGLRGYQMFRAPTRQNVHNPAGYDADLRRGADPNWVRRFLEAEFNEFEGAVYWNFRDGDHIIAPFEIPDHWPLFLAIDWGLADETAALVLAADEVGNVFVTQEYCRAERLISEQCADILGMLNGRKLDWSVIDPSANRREQSTGKSLLDQYREGGLSNLVEANNRLHDGIAAVQEMLRFDGERPHPVTHQPGSPRLHVFRTCPRLIDQFHSYLWGPDGKPVKGNDHLMDALRYGIVRKPHAAVPLEVVKMRPSARLFWDQIAAEAAGSSAPLPRIGAGAGGGWA
jgi:hypothetical protein